MSIHSLDQLPGLNFLVIEDDEATCLLIKEVFKPYSIHLSFAKDGVEGLKQICSSNDFDLLICDLKLPYISGYQLAAKFKELYPAKPIIIQTAILSHFLNEEALKYNGLINKPFDVNAIAEYVFDCLNLKKEHFLINQLCSK